MNSDSINPRLERTWEQLQSWAYQWRPRNRASYFAGSLGGASLTQVFFRDVRLHAIGKLLAVVSAELRFAKAEQGQNEATLLLARDVPSFLAGHGNGEHSHCLVQASAKMPLMGDIFEHHIIIERLVGVTADADVTLTWVPLVAFLKYRELKGRFLAIFDWFFRVQQILEAEKVLLCLEHCPHPRNDLSGWMEI